jgi:drug/metabolite transporter (DMT)-like permease
MIQNGLPPLALVLVLSSALVHALWNVLLARAPRGFDATAVGSALGFLAWAPLALTHWRVDGEVWPYLLLSAAFQVAYVVVLNLAYARVPAHAAYPVARGLAPVLLLAVAVLAGARVSAWAGFGVAIISAGVLLTASGAANRRAFVSALPVAVSLAGYTFITSRGLHHADPTTYLWLSMVPVVTGGVGIRLAIGRGTAALRAQLRPATLVMGLGMFGAHGLTLAALAMVTAAQVPAVAAIRETGILFVVALSWLAARRSQAEPSDVVPARSAGPSVATALAAALVFTGVAVLAIT